MVGQQRPLCRQKQTSAQAAIGLERLRQPSEPLAKPPRSPISDPFATDYAYFAAASAMTGDMTAAKSAAANVARLDPDWTVEKYLSDGGGYPENVALLFVQGARKAGVAACVPAEKISSMPNLVHLRICDEERASQGAG